MMTREQKIFIGILTALGLLSALNIWLMCSLERKTPPAAPLEKLLAAGSKAAREMREEALPPGRHQLVPEDPAKYGFIAVSEAQMPRDQMEWNALMERAIIQSGILETPQGMQAVDQMNTSREKFGDTMQRVDQSIAAFEKAQAENPSDAYTQQRLKTLYKLKAMGKVMADKVATLSKARDLPVPTMAVDAAPDALQEKVREEKAPGNEIPPEMSEPAQSPDAPQPDA